MENNIDYKKLWIELCEEKKQLQIENYRLNKDSNFFRNKFENLEKIYSVLNQKNWNNGWRTTVEKLRIKITTSEDFNYEKLNSKEIFDNILNILEEDEE